MISTVTVSTVSTITNAAMAGTVALMGILVLFGLLIQKEVTTASSNPRLRQLGSILNISIIPLLIAFVLTVIAKVALVLR